jgi:hypothetical protein
VPLQVWMKARRWLRMALPQASKSYGLVVAARAIRSAKAASGTAPRPMPDDQEPYSWVFPSLPT